MEPDAEDDRALAVRKLIRNGQFAEAYAQCEPLARAGSVEAQAYFGHLYHCGKGVPRDLDEAERWYRKAYGAFRSPIVAHKLARLYYDRNDLTQMREWVEIAAAAAYPAAVYQLGRLYLFGIGIPQDVAKGWKYIDQAAGDGHVWARRLVALDMLKGHRGLRQIPHALVMMWQVTRDYASIESEDRNTELTHRGW
jgi:TPR repeat protein